MSRMASVQSSLREYGSQKKKKATTTKTLTGKTQVFPDYNKDMEIWT